jgi:hypothetical protein
MIGEPKHVAGEPFDCFLTLATCVLTPFLAEALHISFVASPYRIAAKPTVAEQEEPCPDAELLPVLGIVWAGSALRVIVGMAHGEVFGTEPTLALLFIVFGPLLAKNVMFWHWRRLLRRAA